MPFESPESTSFSLTLNAVTSTSTGIVHTIGTIAQALPASTSAVVGDNYVETLVATATGDATPFEVGVETLTESAFGYSDLTVIVEQTTESAADASDELVFDVITSLTDTATGSSSFVAEDFVTLSDTATASDLIAQWAGVTLTDTANATNSFEFERSYTLEDSATASETITPGVTYNQLVADTANASDEIWPGGEVVINETATASDELVDSLVISELLTSTATAESSFVTAAVASELLTDSATANESFTWDGSIYSETLSDSANASDWLWSKDFGSIAWVLNTQSGGLTNYDNFGFSSMAFHNGVLYATSPDGLYELGADNDDGRSIDALYKTGFLDFNSESKKRISDIFVGYTGGDLECDVETFDEAVYTYPMQYRDADAPRNSRIKPGRGLASRYWRFGLRNVGGADFQIQDIAVQLAVSKRRI